MGESMKSLFRRGAISSKQMGKMSKPAILNKTTSQPSKMADFNSKTKNEGAGKLKGELPGNEIDHSTNQRAGSPKTASGLPSKGAGVGKTGAQPGAGAINQKQTPAFPRGGSVSAAHGKRAVGIKGHGGKSSGPQYGGPNSRADG